jgi:hypothetical protein
MTNPNQKQQQARAHVVRRVEAQEKPYSTKIFDVMSTPVITINVNKNANRSRI